MVARGTGTGTNRVLQKRKKNALLCEWHLSTLSRGSRDGWHCQFGAYRGKHMVVDAFDTCGWDRAGPLASSVSSRDEVEDGLCFSDCETVFACPDYDGDGSHFDDDTDIDFATPAGAAGRSIVKLVLPYYSEPSRLPRVWFCRCQWRYLINKRTYLSTQNIADPIPSVQTSFESGLVIGWGITRGPSARSRAPGCMRTCSWAPSCYRSPVTCTAPGTLSAQQWPQLMTKQ